MDLFDRILKAIIKKNHPTTDDDEIAQWTESTSFWASKNIVSMQMWVVRTQLMLKKNLDDVQVDTFFIRLYGILVDIPNYISPQLKLFRDDAKRNKRSMKEEISASITRNASMRSHLIALVDINESLDKIRSFYSPEDIFAITYFRHSYCHPVLKDYRVKMKVEGKILIFDAKKYNKFLEHHEIDELEVCKKSFEQLQALQSDLTEMEEHLKQLR